MSQKRTTASLRRERRRLSPENQAFRKQLECLMISHHLPERIAYVMKQDLKKMTDMLYYGMNVKSPHKGGRIELLEVLKEYVQFLLRVNDLGFASRLLRLLNRQQTQVLRRFAPRIGQKCDVWDHVIPTSYVVAQILEMLSSKNTDDLEILLELYAKAGQRGISKEEDAMLNSHGLRDAMPNGWSWRNKNADIFARYRATKVGDRFFIAPTH